MKTIKFITVLISLVFLSTVCHAANLGDIVTAAGGGVGDLSPATSVSINKPTSVAVDSSGNLYIADSFNRVRKVAAGTGIITTVAGNGQYGFGGDNGPATAAKLTSPDRVVVDTSGNLYVADGYSNYRVRKVDGQTGAITTVANISAGGLAVDSGGNLYISDSSHYLVFKVENGTGIITTVAGTGSAGFSGDNGPATAASLNLPTGLVLDGSGNLYIADSVNSRIRKVDLATGIITTVAGNGAAAFGGDNGAATAASLHNPYAVAVDSGGNLYIADSTNNRIRKVTSGTGIITTVAGNGMTGFGGDNGAATAAKLEFPRDITFDGSGNLYIADYFNLRIRKVASGTGIITTVAGNGTEAFAGDNGPATAATFNSARGGVAVDSAGNIYIADENNHRIRKVASGTGIVTTVAGNGVAVFGGDNGPATSASLQYPSRVVVDSSGNLFIADTSNHRVRKVDSGTGIITTVAGNGFPGFSGDNGAATSAGLYWPISVAFDGNGDLYIADYGNHRIRKVASATGLITTVAGNGTAGFSGDGGAAIGASLYRPSDVKFDSSGNLYLVDYYNQRIRKVATGSGIITTVAGNGSQGYGGDSGPATSASLNNPFGITVDSVGNLFIADEWNHRIRKVSSDTGTITTLAGNGSYGFSGDNVPGISAYVYDPTGVTIDGNGNLYITEWGTQRIRKMYLNPVPTVTVLVSSAIANNCVSGSAVTFTATVTGTEKIPAGTTVTFRDGATVIGTGSLDAAGMATFTTASLASGVHDITASYPDNGILGGSTSAVLVQTVAVLQKQSQSIAFAPPATATYGDAPITLYATATSGLPVTFAATGPASVSGNMLTITGLGDIVVTASQAGNYNFTAAGSVEKIITAVSRPTLTVSALSGGSVTNNTTLNVSGSVSDLMGIKSLTVNGTAVAVNDDGSFSHALSLVPGDNAITVVATNVAAKSSTDTRTVTLDQTAPTLVITAPADNGRTASALITVTGTVDEAATITVSDNAGNAHAVTMDGNTFTSTLPVTPGLNTIGITAVDLARNSVAAKRTVIYDNQNPSLTVIAPDHDITVQEDTLTIRAAVADALSTVSVTVTLDGTDYHPAVGEDGNFVQALTFAEERTYPIMVTAVDGAGNSSTVQRNVIYSRGVIAINNGAAATASPTVTLALNYYPGAAKMQLLVNNLAWTAWAPFSATSTVTLPAGDGLKTVSVRFMDPQGQTSAVYSDSILLDTRPPTGSVAINGGAAATTSPDVTLTLSASDISATLEMQVSETGTFAGAAWESFATTRSFHLTGAFGTGRVYARFRDAGGKVSAIASDSILYQQQEMPAGATGGVVINSGATYTTVAGVSLGITPPAGSTNMSFSGNGTTWGSWIAAGTSKAYTLSSGDGVKTVYVRFRNAAGMISGNYSDSIILDTKGPVGAVAINGGAYSTNTSTVTLELTASDVNGVAKMQFYVGGIAWTEWEPFAPIRTIDLLPGNGIRKVMVRYKDNAGKISTAYSDTIVVDAVAPVGTVKINAGAAMTMTPDVTLAIAAAGYPVSMQVSVEEGEWGAWEPFAHARTVHLPGGAGEKRVSVRFRDASGNISVLPCFDTILLVQ